MGERETANCAIAKKEMTRIFLYFIPYLPLTRNKKISVLTVVDRAMKISIFSRVAKMSLNQVLQILFGNMSQSCVVYLKRFIQTEELSLLSNLGENCWIYQRVQISGLVLAPTFERKVSLNA